MLRVIPIFALAALIACDPEVPLGPEVEPPSESALRLTCTSGVIPDAFPARVFRGSLDWEWTTGGGSLSLSLEDRNPGQGFEDAERFDTTLDGPPSVYTDLIDGAGEGIAVRIDRDPALGSAGLRTGTLTVEDLELPLVCWTADFVPPVQFDASSGTCTRDDGTAGRISLPVPFVRETGLGQCVDFAGAALDEGDYTYPVWKDFDLRGADLSRASMSFAHIETARLEGTSMEGFAFGYATITGSIDGHTGVPSEGCVVEGNALDCMR